MHEMAGYSEMLDTVSFQKLRRGLCLGWAHEMIAPKEDSEQDQRETCCKNLDLSGL